MKNEAKKRGGFTSSLGFILAATGSAVGLGNLWKFPYIAGEGGGAIFVLIYLFFVLVLGVPIMLGEMAIGRKTKLNPIGAYHKLNKKFTFIGVIGVVCAFIILSYYSVIGGWVLKYITTYVTNTHVTDASAYFKNFIQSPVEPVIWHIVFMALTCIIVIGGVAKGIERASKIMLPLLFIFIIIIAIRSVTLPGAMEGVKYFVIPNFSHIDSISEISKVLLAAMGQVFFSLSLGMGAIITYGSYLNKEVNLQKSAFIIPTLDTLVAVLAGFAILPAVFAFGFKPTAGPGLLFETLPKVFESMPFGVIFGVLFFVLVFFAAITSSVSLLEVVTSYCIDNLKMKRATASIIIASIMTIIGIFAALSFGPLADVKFFGNTIFDLMSFVSDKLLMPLGGFFMCIFVGYIWGIDNASEEISNDGSIRFRWKKLFSIIMKYIAPAIILVIFITSFLPTK
ncbi:sodium-dependent transporter [Paludicola sp. MB14-C6]|uniref:sodium-dependent transporter n=1 Tax=Paludihabitans sp. MB14-C6 TaxID=3070656 RepID=UPI0027DE7EA0|nr:sodium-dependent transporter [Paludicola sp. MB14-C6]WMJ22083.1 sodium-dependent transporter [Paludicola sp. MB14-C6]